MQELINGQMSKMRSEKLASSKQLLLGELVLKLEAVKATSKPVVFDFGMKPAGASSWRGSYRELGLEYSKSGGGGASWNGDKVTWESEDGDRKFYEQDKFIIPKNPSAQQFLDMLKALTDKDMVGYKGGDFTMHKNVAVYFGNYGEYTVDNYKGKEYVTVAPFDVVEQDKKVVVITDEIDDD